MKMPWRRWFPEWFPLEKAVTPYQRLEVVRQKGRLVLNAPHTNYSFGSLHEVFQSAFRQLHPDYGKIESVLILGFGAGSVAHILQKENGCPCSVTGVEIDKKVIEWAKKYFRLDELQHLQLYCDDASAFLSKNANRYSLIVTDLFLDHRTPDKFLTPGFLQKLKEHLLPNGIVLFNYLLYDFEAKEKAVEFEKAFRETFQNVRRLTFKKQPKNLIFAGTL
jgi:spermidine synthase